MRVFSLRCVLFVQAPLCPLRLYPHHQTLDLHSAILDPPPWVLFRCVQYTMPKTCYFKW